MDRFWGRAAVTVAIGAAAAGCGAARGGGGDVPGPEDGTLVFRYAIELEDRGELRRVTEDFPFRSGDRFRFVVESGFPAHLYLFNRGAGDRTYTRLFPRDAADDRRALPRGREMRAPPGDGWYRMDTRTGIENLVLVVATAPLGELGMDLDADRDANAFEQRLGELERAYRPSRSGREQAGDDVELVADRGVGETALVVRIPLRHEVGP